jgi:hypothetical protein
MSTDRTLTTEPCRTLHIGAITFEYRIVPLGDYVDDGLMIAMGHFAQEIGLPAAFRRFIQIEQKQLRYDPLDKLLTFFISLVEGCGYTSDINQRLKPYPALADAWTLASFPGQSAVNGTLHVLTGKHLQQIEQVFQFLFERNSFALRRPRDEPVVVDIDTKGLPVSPRSHRFEGATRGYFPGGPNQKGLQFTAAFLGAGFREVLGGHVAPGYAHLLHGLPAILQLIEKRLGPSPRRGALLQDHARSLDAEAKKQLERATLADQHLQRAYVHLHLLQTRIQMHQAQIQALKGRIQRLPKRARKLRRQLVSHQAKIRLDRRRAKREHQQLDHWRQRAQQAREDAEMLREGARNRRRLAETPIELGTVRLIVLRADSGLGTGDTITTMMECGYLFVVKGRDARTARKLTTAIGPHDWQRVDAHLRAAEAMSTRMPSCPFDVRLVVCERTSDQNRLSYYVLVTNLPLSTYGTVALVAFYNARQTIEAFNKVMGNVLFLDHLRTGSLTANEAVAQLAMLGHDFLSWATHRFFTGTPYEAIAIRELVQKGLHVIARVSWTHPNLCCTELALDSPYACAFVTGAQGANGQLSLPLDASPPLPDGQKN